MNYVLKKLAGLIATLILISMVTFFAFSVIPGDAAITKLGLSATEAQIESLRESMGIYAGNFEGYIKWLKGAITGNFGNSYRYQMTVTALIGSRLTATTGLALLSIFFMVIFSVPLAIISARRPNSALDNAITVLTQIGMATPQFFLGIVLTLIFGIMLSWFKVGGYVSANEDFWGFVSFMILPAISVSVPKISMMIKFLRDGIVKEKTCDYVRTARAKGNSESRILFCHILKNAIVPTITFFAMAAAEVLAGAIVAEEVFGIPGVGELLVTSISNRDYPVVQALVLYTGALVVIMNTFADIMYKIVDKRVE